MNSTPSTLVTSTPTDFTTNTTENISTTTLWTGETKEESIRNFWIGLALAVSSAIFTGSSFILKKKGLLNVSQGTGGTRAGN